MLDEFQPHRFQEGVGRVPAGEVIRNHYPRVISDDLWSKCRAGLRTRCGQRGRVSPSVNNLFTSLVYQGDVRCQLRTRGNRESPLQSVTRVTPGVLDAPFERVLLWFLRAVEVREDETGGYDALKAHADRLASSVKQLRPQFDADSDMADMLSTLAKWKREHHEAVEMMEAAAVPVQTRHLHNIRLVRALKSAAGQQLETLRREVRQAVRQVIERVEASCFSRKNPLTIADADRLNVQVSGDMPKSMRLVVVFVRMTTGDQHSFTSTTTGSRITAGVHILTADGLDHVDQGEAFPVDPPSARAAKEPG